MVLGIVCILVMVLVGIAFIAFSMNTGGSRELQQVTDGATLNVAQEALTLSVPVKDIPFGSQLADVADTQGRFTLRNINQAYAKALIIAMNAYDIQKTSGENTYTEEHVTSIAQAVQRLSETLSQKVTSSSTLQNYFTAIMRLDSVRMLNGNSIEVDTDSNQWDKAYCDRGAESNVFIQSNQIPSTFSSSALQLVTASDGKSYLPGYNPLRVGSRQFCLVPFRQGHMSHLIDPTVFSPNRGTPFQGIPPNAFSGAAKVALSDQSRIARCSAYAQTNPQQSIQAQIQGFIRIVLPANKAIYMYEGIEFSSQQYGYDTTEQVVEIPEIPICCTGQVEATLGNESLPGMLYNCLFPETAVDSQANTILPLLLQRINEMNPNYTSAQLVSLLMSQPVTPETTSTQTFYIWADEKFNIHIGRTPLGAASFFNTNAPADGNQKQYQQAFTFDEPNFAIAEVEEEEPDCVPVPPEPVVTTELEGQINWSPGTGYDGFLGELSISRTCYVTVDFASCIVIPPI